MKILVEMTRLEGEVEDIERLLVAKRLNVDGIVPALCMVPLAKFAHNLLDKPGETRRKFVLLAIICVLFNESYACYDLK